MTAFDIDIDLREQMLLWAIGDLGATAAVQLLIDNGNIPELLWEAGYAIGSRTRGSDVAPLFRDVVRDLDEGTCRNFYLSHSQEAILRIAASLAGKASVNLWRTLGTLDTRNAGLVRHALEVATGMHQ